MLVLFLLIVVLTINLSETVDAVNVSFIISEKPANSEIFKVTSLRLKSPALFYITDVKSTKIPSSPDDLSPDWRNHTLNGTANDCENADKNLYPETRNNFCIDHLTGQVFVSSKFPRNHLFDIGYVINIEVEDINGSREIQIYNVLARVCDESYHEKLRELAADLSRDCPVTVLSQVKPYHRERISNFSDSISVADGDHTDLVAISFGNISPNAFPFSVSTVTIIIEIYYLEETVTLNITDEKSTFLQQRLVYLEKPLRFYGFPKSQLPTPYVIEVYLSLIPGEKFPFALIPSASFTFMTLLNDKNSCGQLTCVKKFYAVEKYQNSSCGETTGLPDLIGYKAKYGFCEGFNITLNQPYVFSLSYDSKNYTLIGKINATSNFDVFYFIKSVFQTTGRDSSTAIDAESGITPTLNLAFDDCSSLTLKSYTVPRRFFCIDHYNGNLYTTPEFEKYNHYGTEKYSVVIEMDNVRQTETQTLNISVTSPCENVVSAYTDVIKHCSNFDKRYTPAPSVTDLQFLFPFESIFVSFELHIEENLREEFLEFTVEGSNETVRRFIAPYDEKKNYYFNLENPLRVTKSDIERKRYRISIESAIGIIKPKNFTLYYLPLDTDFCENDLCQQLTSRFLKEKKQNGTCNIDILEFDRFSFQYKYNFCSESSKPSVEQTEHLWQVSRLTPPLQTKILDGNYADPKANVTYRLNGVFGPSGTLQIENRTINTINCTSLVFSIFLGGPKFCMDEKTGDIYLIVENDEISNKNSTYLFNITIYSTTFPTRITNTFVTIVLYNECFPSNTFYNRLNHEMSGCWNWQTLSFLPTKEKELNVSIQLQNIKAVMGFSILSNAFSKNATQYILRVWVDSRKHEYQDNIDNKLQTQLVNSFDLNAIDSQTIYVALYEMLPANKKEISIGVGIGDLIVYAASTWDFCNNEFCINIYKNWLEAIQNYSTDSVCRRDSSFYSRYYGICTDLQPRFIGKAKIDEFGFVQGCSYNSIVDLNKHTYFLINGTKQVNITGIIGGGLPARKRRSAFPNGQIYDFPPFKVNSFDDEGTFQCVIYDPSRMSKPVMSNQSENVRFRDPIFIEWRNNVNTTVLAGGNYIKLGCSYSSPFPLAVENTYYLKNGKEKVGLQVTSRLLDSGVYQFDAFSIVNAKLSDEGEYQCVLLVRGKAILSAIVNITVQGPVIDFTESTMTISQLGSSRSLNCEFKSSLFQVSDVSGRVFKTINYTGYWFLNGSQRMNASILYQGRSIYRFTELFLNEYSQTGIYQCVVTHDAYLKNAVISNKSDLIKFDDPYFSSNETVLTNYVPLYSFAKLVGCHLNSQARITADNTYWVRNDEKLSIKHDLEELKIPTLIGFQVKFADVNLTVNNFTMEGDYYCVVFVPDYMKAPIKQLAMTLRINDLDLTFTDQPRYAIDNSTGLLKVVGCIAQQNSTLPYNGSMLGYWTVRQNKTQHNAVTIYPDSSNRYHFPDIFVNEIPPEQLTDVRCVLENKDVLRIPRQSKALYNWPGFESGRPFSIITGPLISSNNIKPGDDVKITGCKVNSIFTLTPEKYNWYKDEKRLNVSTNITINITKESNQYFSDLVIRNVNVNDQGSYKCGIGLGEIQFSNTIDLQVTVPIVFTQQPRVDITDDIIRIIGCKYTSNRKIVSNIFWLHNGSNYIPAFPIPTRRRRNIDATKNGFEFSFDDFIINSVDQLGEYQCVINEERSKPAVVTRIPKPTFQIQPKLLVTSTKIGGNISIGGCSFHSYLQYKKENLFWLKDGYKKIFPADWRITPTIVGSYDYFLSGISYSKANYSIQGYYQCVIQVDGYAQDNTVSEKINVQFNDLSDTRMIVKINDNFTEDYVNPQSKNYVTLKRKVESELEEILDRQNMRDAKSRRIVEVLQFRAGSIEAVVQVVYQNATSDERLNICKQQQMKATDFKAIDVSAVTVNNLDCCQKNSFGDDSFKGKYTFSDTLVTSSVSDTCAYNQDGSKSSVQCISDLEQGPQWSNIDLKSCLPKTKTTKALLDLNETTICSSNRTINCSAPEVMSSKLVSTIANGAVITTKEDIEIASILMGNIIDSLEVDENETAIPKRVEQVTNDLLKVVSNILDTKINHIARAQNATKSSTRILENLDNLAKTIGKILVHANGGSVSKGFKNIGMTVSYIPKNNIDILATDSHENISIAIQNATTSTFLEELSTIMVPIEAFSDVKEVVYSFVFRNDDFFLNALRLKAITSNINSLPPRLVQSAVLSASFSNRKITNLTVPISLTFKKIVEPSAKGNNTCEFWDFKKDDVGSWSDRGCYLTQNQKQPERYITCECDHFTNFALLLDVSQTGSNPLELQIVTWIGCGISLAGLFLTMLTFLIFPTLRKKLPPKILLCLSFSIMALLIIFLAGVEQTKPRKACQTVSALLQYFMLTTFCWMIVEGINLYRCFVKVFNTGSQGKFMIIASFFAWGVPAIIVGITAGVAPEHLGNDRFCVVYGLPFYIGVLAPIALILVINFIILITVMKGLSQNAMTSRNKDNARNVIAQSRIAFMCSVLLGATWVFALFAVSGLTSVFQWLFCIFNSLQGFFIFFFYTLRNSDVQNEWMRCCGKRKTTKTSHVSNTTSSDMKKLKSAEKKDVSFNKQTLSTTANQGYESDSSEGLESVQMKSFTPLKS